jgi:hypothetical protein
MVAETVADVDSMKEIRYEEQDGELGTLFKNIKNVLTDFIDYGSEGSCHGKPD